jgi:uncharacterized protein YggE
VSIQPDQAIVMIGVETSSDNVLDATAEAGDIMEALLTAFQGEGINVSDIQTSGYNVWTDWGGQQVGQQGATPTYRVNNTVRVVVRDLDNVSTVLDAAFSAGANSIQGITFTVDDRTALESEARAEALTDARSRAEELATALDVELTAIVSVSEVVGNQVFPALRDAATGMGGGGAGPISPGELSFSVQLQVVYAIE